MLLNKNCEQLKAKKGHLLEALGRAISSNNMFPTFIVLMSVFETESVYSRCSLVLALTKRIQEEGEYISECRRIKDMKIMCKLQRKKRQWKRNVGVKGAL